MRASGLLDGRRIAAAVSTATLVEGLGVRVGGRRVAGGCACVTQQIAWNGNREPRRHVVLPLDDAPLVGDPIHEDQGHARRFIELGRI